jgi:hypothetical protein
METPFQKNSSKRGRYSAHAGEVRQVDHDKTGCAAIKFRANNAFEASAANA